MWIQLKKTLEEKYGEEEMKRIEEVWRQQKQRVEEENETEE